MTKQEVKDEFKETEGNPEQKGHIRRRAMDISNARILSDVPDADVIVNNPTHISVAIKYTKGKTVAPVVVAKGADLIAFQIRKIAKGNGVPMVENIPLARGLYKQVKVGERHTYRLISLSCGGESLRTYVYRLKK